MGFGSYSPSYGGGPNWPMIAALAVIPIAVITAAIIGLSAYLSTERIDTATYCFSRADQHQVAFFADASFTRSSSAAQWRDYETALMRAYDEAPPNARISIFTTTRDAASSFLPPVGSQCRPPETVLELAQIGAPSQTPQYLARQAQEAREAYRTMVEHVLGALRDDELRALESPILASLQAISRSEFFDGEQRTLWFLTDGLEASETALFGQVRNSAPPYEIFASQPRWEAVRPDSLTGTHVNLLLVESTTLPGPGLEFITHAELRAFWSTLFIENGADSVELTRLRHGAE
ncbi:MAG: hypothetical protein GYB36_12860 [Alphaproteobacteria bacterium]|nr:hypothetical protein [Alphaproteobacteria bacterium]